MLELGIKFTIAYLIGSFLGSLVVGWLYGGIDIRAVGSGNAGGTNALRTQGKLFAFWVMLIDVGKGVLVVLLLPGLEFPASNVIVNESLLRYSVAFAVVLGHVYPLWFGFRGGKGGATAAGLLLVLEPTVAPFVIGTWVAIVLITGYVGLATMIACVSAACIFALLRLPEQHDLVIFSICISLLIIFTHRSNIQRMLNGTESRIRRQFGGR